MRAWTLATFVRAAVIVALAAQPDLHFAPDADWDFAIRKTGHMAVFGLLALSVWRSLIDGIGLTRPAAWALLLTGIHAATDEFHQGFTSGRHPALTDVVIDVAGGAMALLAGTLLAHRWHGR